MRIERQYDRRAARGPRVVTGLPNDALVPEMDAIEHADRQTHLLGTPGQLLKCSKDLH